MATPTSASVFDAAPSFNLSLRDTGGNGVRRQKRNSESMRGRYHAALCSCRRNPQPPRLHGANIASTRVRMIARLLAFFTRFLTAGTPRWRGWLPVPRQRIYFANHTSNLDFVLLWAALWKSSHRQRLRDFSAHGRQHSHRAGALPRSPGGRRFVTECTHDHPSGVRKFGGLISLFRISEGSASPMGTHFRLMLQKQGE